MIVMIDNYDSFTFNLVQYMMMAGAEVKVFRNDEISIGEIRSLKPHGIVISPGPCTPNEAGISLEVVRKLSGEFPILGVCLGHQSIGQAFGGQVNRAPELMHGKVSRVAHDGSSLLFKGVPENFTATRYHSLIVAEHGLPECLRVTARTENGLIMALEHMSRPVYGVQFHPESILTEYGHEMIGNFLRLAGELSAETGHAKQLEVLQ